VLEDIVQMLGGGAGRYMYTHKQAEMLLLIGMSMKERLSRQMAMAAADAPTDLYGGIHSWMEVIRKGFVALKEEVGVIDDLFV